MNDIIKLTVGGVGTVTPAADPPPDAPPSGAVAPAVPSALAVPSPSTHPE